MWPRKQNVVALAGGATGRRPRDPRIDAFRGLALIFILIDHIPGNPYERFTVRNWGFSDAAECFFVMSGIAAGIAYSGRFLPEARATNGLWAAVRPVWARAWTLYMTQVFLTCWAIAIFAWGASHFGLPDLLTQINLRQVFQNTGEALVGVPLMTHQLGYVNILPAYFVLLLCTPVAIVLGMRHPKVLIGASVALWLAAGIWRLNLPNYPNPGGWFFNPVAWQLIFVIGLMTGMRLRRGERLVPVSPKLFALAVGYLVLVVVWRYVPDVGKWINHRMAVAGTYGLPFNLTSHDKTFLALPRLLHVLAMAYVLSCLPVVYRMTGSRWAAPLRLIGRHGLLTFSLGTLVSLLFQVLMASDPDSAWMPWLLPLAGVGAMLAAAALRDRITHAPKRAPAPARAAPEPAMRLAQPAE